MNKIIKGVEDDTLSYYELKSHNDFSFLYENIYVMKNKTQFIKQLKLFPDPYIYVKIFFQGERIVSTIIQGVFQNERVVNLPAQSTVVSIRFSPLCVDLLMKQNLDFTVNSFCPIDIRDIGLNEDSISSNLNNYNKLANIIEMDLLKSIDLSKKDNVFYVFDNIIKWKGGIKLRDLSSTLNINRDNIYRMAKQRIGISMKDYCKTYRFYNNLKNLKNKFMYHDYYDTSDLNKNIKSYTNLTPRQIIDKNTVDYLQLFFFKNRILYRPTFESFR
ncbi:hypothetical protein FUAX_41980 (plasmid) [Fulvitalea axinellae]|uniref:HTH araC/xylS-type domain-containing protein n=1 Tax=Fulvitalea axinellae TaxID=1182444 RepID=A0AAU9CHY7_9BACT|nr:hypothetical protein FUAX_41980 [Fulvitalea axinellae]